MTEFKNTAIRETDGTISRRSSSSLAFEVGRDRTQAREIAIGPRQARHETGAHRIADRDHDERHSARCLLHGKRRGRPGCDDHIHLGGDELGDQRREAFVLSVRPAVFDGDIAAFLIAKFAKALAE